MKQVLTVALTFAVLVLGYFIYSQSLTIKALQRAQESDVVPSLEMQGRCAKQASDTFTQLGYNAKGLAEYTNHYSKKMGKCFMVIANTSTTVGSVSTSKNLSDAFEGKVYGSYIWINSQGKKYWEVAPTECTVTLQDGQEKQCTSVEEWDNLAKTYMEAN